MAHTIRTNDNQIVFEIYDSSSSEYRAELVVFNSNGETGLALAGNLLIKGEITSVRTQKIDSSETDTGNLEVLTITDGVVSFPQSYIEIGAPTAGGTSGSGVMNAVMIYKNGIEVADIDDVSATSDEAIALSILAW